MSITTDQVCVYQVAGRQEPDGRARPSALRARGDGTCHVEREGIAGRAVADLLELAGLDAGNAGTPQWNPFGSLIHPGETVVLKPNLVKESHPRDPEGWRYVLTDGDVIRTVADYVFQAVGQSGKVVVADGPQTDSSFTEIVRILGLDRLQDQYLAQGYQFELVDLRKEEWISRGDVITERRKLLGDPAGYVAYDLGDSSEFVGHEGAGYYYGADYDEGEVNRHHTGGRHEYLISGTIARAAVLLSLPKLKTHKKAGVTASLKNFVGINGDKNWLPHHTEAGGGLPGDERPAGDPRQTAEKSLIRPLRRLAVSVPGLGPWFFRHAKRVGRHVFGDTAAVIRSGNWYGNDTIWRMCLDLNKIALYGNADGTLRPEMPRYRKRHYVLVDGLLAGEGRGPLDPDPVKAGLLVFGTHPASVDATCAVLMGFDPEKIPIVRQAFRCRRYPLAEWDWREVESLSNRPEWCGNLRKIDPETTFHFVPHFGWTGHIERVQT